MKTKELVKVFKKRFLTVAIAAVMTSSVLLSGCGNDTAQQASTSEPTTELPDKAGNTNKKGGYDQDNIAPETGYVALNVKENADVAALDEGTTRATRDAIGLDDMSIQKVKTVEKGNYCYDALDAETQTLYVELLTIVNNHAEDVMVSTTDADKLQKAFQCMYNDHPEIYWVDGYSYTKHTKNDAVVYLTFSGQYTYTAAQCAGFKSKIDGYVSQCLGGISKGASDYDKVKYVYEYLINHTDYVLSSPDNQNILSVFVNGKSVCQGYAKATQYLLQQLGVPCTMVVGSVVGGEGHAWDLVRVNGSYYYVDTTWGDSSYSVGGQSVDMGVNYDFLNITTSELEKTHKIDSVVTMPKCVATTDNYYVKESLLFDSFDSAKLKRAFDNAYKAGDKTLTIKCANSSVYNTVISKLIDEQLVFDYLKSDSVTYAASDEDLTISLWL